MSPILKHFFLFFMASNVFLKASDSDSDYVDMEEVLEFVDGDAFHNEKQAINQELTKPLSPKSQGKIAQANNELLAKKITELKASHLKMKQEEKSNQRIFLTMWLEGGIQGLSISPFTYNKKRMNDEINAYCSKQNDSFKSWYQDNLKKYKHVDLLHQLKDKLVFKNGNSFIHELIARNNIDWLYALGPEKINEHVKNKNKKTVLQALKEKLAYPDHHQLMIMRLIQFFGNRNQLL